MARSRRYSARTHHAPSASRFFRVVACVAAPSTNALDSSPSVYDGCGIQFVQKSSGVAGRYRLSDGKTKRRSTTMAEHIMTAKTIQMDRLKERVRPLLHFWQKVSNDWVFNLSGLLAYNILMTMFPILLALLTIAGFILATVSPGS